MIRNHFLIGEQAKGYRGRLAPTPSGPLHLGHARTFAVAANRAASHGGELLLRIEDIDRERCREAFVVQAIAMLRDLGLEWSGEPLRQSTRIEHYRAAAMTLAASGWIYPSPHSRREILAAAGGGIEIDDPTPLFPSRLRPQVIGTDFDPGMPWRFRVPDGEVINVRDRLVGDRPYRAGQDFGDFLVWRRDGWPTYELAVVVDDIAQSITEVVRGADLVKSTARQILLYRAFGASPPDFVHCPLLLDPRGEKLSKSRANYTTPDPVAIRTILAEAREIAQQIPPFPLSPSIPDSRNLDR